MRVDHAYLGIQSGFDDLLCLSAIQGVERYWYQIETAKKVLKYFHGRVLLCDEVGLGKTIETGILMKEYLRERELSYLVATKTNAWYPTKALDSVPRIVVPASNLEGSRFWQARAMVPTDAMRRWKSAKGAKHGSIVIVWPEKFETGMKMVVVEGLLHRFDEGFLRHIFESHGAHAFLQFL